MHPQEHPRSNPVVRQWLATVSLILMFASPALMAGSIGSAGAAQSARDPVAAAVARQEIEYLRRHYARATDLIGQNTPESIAAGRAIYQAIFTPDAQITVTANGVETLRSTGPDEWVDVVIGAIGSNFRATQHLIGTQLVDIKSLPGEEGSHSGEASMTSYLQAWHDSAELVDVFIGTYSDQVRHSPQAGWQIYRMNLDQTAHEVRKR